MNYGEVFGRAFQVAWRHRYLWLLGLSGGEFSGGASFNGSSTTGTTPLGPSGTAAVGPGLQPYSAWLQSHLGLIVVLGLAGLVIAVAWFLVGCVASGGLVKAVAEIDAGHGFGPGQAWSAGLRTFPRVLALRLLAFLLVLLPALVLAGPPLGLALSRPPDSLVWLLLLIPAGLLLVFWAVLVDVVVKLALRCLVLELLGPLAALRAGTQLLVRRFGRIALVWLLLLVVGFGVGIASAIPAVLVSVPFLSPLISDFQRGDANALFTGVAGLVIALAVVSLVVQALAGTYWSATWTVAYRRLDLEPGAPPAPSFAVR